MIDALSTPPNRIKTLVLLLISGSSAIAGAAVGVNDNPPGILLALLAATAFVLAFVHPWRTAKRFLILLMASVLVFALYIVLHTMLETVAQSPAAWGVLRDLIHSAIVNALGVIIPMVCAAAFIVGAVGSVAMFIRSRRQPTSGPPTAA